MLHTLMNSSALHFDHSLFRVIEVQWLEHFRQLRPRFKLTTSKWKRFTKITCILIPD
jgi:hypothetical protein